MPVPTNMYNGLIPQDTDQVSVSQGDLLKNFGANQTFVDNNHIDYGNADAGKHFFIQMPVMGGAAWPTVLNPTPTVAATEIALYNANAAPTNVPDIWLKRGVATAYPMTGYVLGGTNAGNGWTYLPSGLLMAWGRSTTGGSNNVTITYAAQLTNFPGFTTANAFPQLTRISGAGTSSNFVTLTNYTQTTFQVYSSAGDNSVQFAWLVIGI